MVPQCQHPGHQGRSNAAAVVRGPGGATHEILPLWSGRWTRRFRHRASLLRGTHGLPIRRAMVVVLSEGMAEGASGKRTLVASPYVYACFQASPPSSSSSSSSPSSSSSQSSPSSSWSSSPVSNSNCSATFGSVAGELGGHGGVILTSAVVVVVVVAVVTFCHWSIPPWSCSPLQLPPSFVHRPFRPITSHAHPASEINSRARFARSAGS
jgi:hypothetical protein